MFLCGAENSGTLSIATALIGSADSFQLRWFIVTSVLIV